MEGIDIYKRKKNCYENELKRLENSPISDKNKETIKRYHQYLFAKGCGELRVWKLSSQLRRVAAFLCKDFNLVDKDDLEKLVVYISREALNQRVISHCYTKKAYVCKAKPLSAETKYDYWHTIKVFFCWLDKRYKELFEGWKPNFGTKNPEIGNMISDEDMEVILKVSTSIRDRAILSLLHETGARAGELLTMHIKDIAKEGKFIKIRLFGKTGERRVLIIHSVPYLLRWLEQHKFRDNPDSFLWISEHPRFKDEPLYHPGLKKLISVAFKKAGLSHVKHNPHFFRHSRATINAKFMTDVQMRLFFGWSNDSSQVATYVHASGRDVDGAVLAMNGIVDENKEERKKPKFCPICKTQNAEISDFCHNCGNALSLKVAIETEAKVNAETNKAFQLLMEIAKNPALMQEFEAFKAQLAKGDGQ